MKKIALVTCVKEKETKPCAAMDLYKGSLFENFMALAKAEHPDETYILSGKHHLLGLESIVAPYDLNLNDVSDNELRTWADRVLEQLREVSDLQKDHFIVIASETYYKYLVPHLRNTTIPTGLVF